MHPFRRLTRFGAVGGVAALCHVGIAVLAHRVLDHAGVAGAALLANLAGFSVASLLSYFGQARLTFGITPDHARHFPRFLAVGLSGLGLSSLVTYLICDLAGGPFLLAMAVVVTAVPALTFVMMRFWAFTSADGQREP